MKKLLFYSLSIRWREAGSLLHTTTVTDPSKQITVARVIIYDWKPTVITASLDGTAAIICCTRAIFYDIFSLLLSPGDPFIPAATLRLWDPDSGRCIKSYQPLKDVTPVTDIRYNEDSLVIAQASGKLSLFTLSLFEPEGDAFTVCDPHDRIQLHIYECFVAVCCKKV
jgi:hypothetical protein